MNDIVPIDYTMHKNRDLYDYNNDERQNLVYNINNKFKFEGQKNPNNPKEILKKVNEVFISKKANYINCMTGYCCVGENVYKIYKYKAQENGNDDGVHEGGENEGGFL